MGAVLEPDQPEDICEVCSTGRHALEPYSMPDDGACDLCAEGQPAGARMRSCRLCDFDVCATCTANLAQRPPPASAAAVEVLERSDDIRKPPCDERAYRYIKLPNQLQVLLVSDPTADKAAASMDVAVGHACDPPELPGLAHFLEHMLFLGTRKYPDEVSTLIHVLLKRNHARL